MALLPLIILGLTAVLIMLVISFYRGHRLTLTLTLLGLAIAFISLPLTASAGNRQVTNLLLIDDYARFYMGLLFAATFAVALLSYGYLKQQHEAARREDVEVISPRSAGAGSWARRAIEVSAGEEAEEFYLLLILATLGAATLVASSHFASFFLGLEILSISLYALIAYNRTRSLNIEAGVKYLVLAAASSAFLLFGMALVYAETGTMQLSGLSDLSAQAGASGNALLLAGLSMLIVGIGFKLAVVPFHLWTPDVYEGAPAPVTAFVASVSKGGMFALLLRYFLRIDLGTFPSLFVVFAAIAVASILAGNLLALLQHNVKRVLAYSSIAHLGYLLVAFLASGSAAVVAVTFYLVSYFVTTIAAFGVVTVLSGPDHDADRREDYRGLFWRRPWSAGILTAALLSLAGIPLTAGFVGKFYILTAGVGSALWFLVIILVIGSSIGLYYYLRIIVTMYLPVEEAEAGEAEAGRRAVVVVAGGHRPGRAGGCPVLAGNLSNAVDQPDPDRGRRPHLSWDGPQPSAGRR